MIKAAPRLKSLMGWMEALSDPTRLRLLRLLEGQELGVAELCDVLQMPQSSVSRHLKLLGGQQWVRRRRDGTSNLYVMAPDELDDSARRLWQLAREQSNGWSTFQQDQLRLQRLIQNRRSDSRSFFAGAAGQWDKLRAELYGRSFSDSALLSLLPRDLVVADLGCGTGEVAAALAPFVKTVIGVDQSDPMLRAARKRTTEFDNVELKKADLESIPISDESCGAAVLLIVLSYVSDPSSVLSEMARILKTGARAVVVDLLAHDREDFCREMGQERMGFDPTELQSRMKRAGFVRTSTIPLSPEPAAKGPALLLATGTKR